MRKLTNQEIESVGEINAAWAGDIFSQAAFSEDDVASAIHSIYSRITEPQPEVVFVDSPVQAVQELLKLKILSDLETDFKPEEFLGVDKKLLYWSIDILAEQVDLQDLEKVRHSCWAALDTSTRRLSNVLDGIVSAIVSKKLDENGAKYSDRDVRYIVSNTIQNNRCDKNSFGRLAYINLFQNSGIDFGYLPQLAALVKSSAMLWMFGEKVIVCRPAVNFCFDERNRFHNENDAALAYADATKFFFWHGTEVSEKIILRPNDITVNDITTERNVEVRRAMLDRFGADRYIQESGATRLHTDDWGILWSAPLPDDEVLVMVEVVNSSPESDGTFKNYWLRVPPTTKTAKEGVAWTFGFDKADDYHPLIQT